VPATVTGGASIEITSDREPERRWTSRADPESGATVSGLPPATYNVIVAPVTGLVVQLDVRLEANEIVSLDFVPAAGGSTAEIRITDRRRQSQGTHFDGETLRRLPTGAGLWGLLDTAAPFVIVDRMDGGGLGVTTPARVGSRGAPWRDTSIRLGEVTVAHGAVSADQLGIIPTLDSFDAVVVSSGSAAADVDSPGATISLVPKRPGARRQGAINLSLTPSFLVATNATTTAPSIARLESWRGFGAQYGGPLSRRVGAFISSDLISSRERDRGATRDLSSSLKSVFGHLIVNPRDRTQARLLLGFQQAEQPYRSQRGFFALATERDDFTHVQAAVDHHTTNGSRFEFGLGYQRGEFRSQDTLSTVSIDRLTDGLVMPDVSNGSVDATDFRVQFASRELRGHVIEAGFTRSHSTSNLRVVSRPRIGELVAGYAARVWQSDAPLERDSLRDVSNLAGYVSDRIRLGSSATADVGLRFARSHGSASGAAGRISWAGVLPRAAIRWSPSPITLFAGYGRYQPRLPVHLLSFGDPGEPLRKVYRWNDADGNGAVTTPNEIGTLIALGGRAPSVASIDPALKTPHTDEFTFGGERRFGTSVVLSATGTIRHEQNIPRSVNTGVPLSSYQVRLVPDQGVFYDSSDDDRLLPVYDRLPESFGNDHFLLTNVVDDTASYEGIEIAVRVTRPRWWSFAGASAYRSEVAGANRGFKSDENDHGVIGEIFENPNANSYAFGRSFFDRAYVLKWATGFEPAPHVSAAVVARYQDGQPFSRLVVVPDLAQGPELVAAYPSGRTRFTFTATIDARLEARFPVGRAQGAFRVEIYNLTNHGLEVEESSLTGANFRRTTAVQPPRTLRLGFHVAF
jgi:hypothetical protein